MSNIEIHQLINAIGWTLIHSIWQIGIYGIIIWIIFRFISKDNARVKYSVAGLGLLFIFLTSVITFLHYISKIPNSAVEGTSITPELLLLLMKSSPIESNFWDLNNLQVDKYFPVLVNLWIIGVFVLSLQMTISYLRTLKLKNHLAYPLNFPTQKIALKLVAKFDLKQNITFKESGYLQIPSLIGYFKPIVLLPVSMLSGIPENQLEIIIAHELAHIKRHDYLFQFIQGILELLFFYHPVFWWLSSVVNTEREHICDDLAVKVCGESLTLIKALNNMEAIRKKQYDLVLGLSGKKDNVLKRAQRILRPKTNVSPKLEKYVLSGLFVFLFTGLILISNLAVSGNSITGDQFFSKINVLDQGDPQVSPSKSSILEVQKKKDKKKKEKKKLQEVNELVSVEKIENAIEVETTPEAELVEVPEVEMEVAEVAEIAPVVEVEHEIEVVEPEVNFELHKDSLKSQKWVKMKTEEIIEEQKKAMEEAAKELEEAEFEFDFQEMQKELQEELKNLDINSEEFQKEMKEQQIEIEEQLRELSDEKFLKEFNKDRELQQKELQNHLKEIQENTDLSNSEKERITKKLKKTVEKINSKEFQNNLKEQLEKAKVSLEKHKAEFDSGKFEQKLLEQREVLKRQFEKMQSPEFKEKLEKQLKESKERIQEQMKKINTPEYRKKIEKQLKERGDTTKESSARIIIKDNLNGKNAPIVIVNGNKISREEFKQIVPNSIESMTILKDETAMEIYGPEAKNGVILIQSKVDNKLSFDKMNLVNYSKENSPLYVVDGKIVLTTNKAELNPNKIESIDVLKGASAIELYGNQAENGAIIITSKNNDSNNLESIRIKGSSGKNAPLYILDGKRINGKKLKKINKNTIESIEVYKDNFAIEKFGEKAKNGVVIITTKS